tara:strand:- start:121365 stop:122228 length:864 start_codon:yes stop_codon:yes gene_type:complete
MKLFNSLIAVTLVSSTMFFSSCNKTTTTTTDPAQVAFEKASPSNGGIMYDKFWATESTFDQANANLANIDANGNFFRCKQCHGWDGLANTGAYNSRGPKTTRPNVSGITLYDMAREESAQTIFNQIKGTTGRRDISYDLSTYDPATNNVEGDKMPNFSQILTDAQIWDIVKFLKNGMFDVSELYDATYTGTYPNGTAVFSNVGRDGNEANGNVIFTAKCVGCHGADGTIIDLEGKTLGKFVRTKPNEAQHKVKYGHLGSPMTGQFDMTVSEMKDLYKALANTTNFPD